MDLSDGGMFIAADMPCDNGTLIKFECQVDGSADMLRGVGRVVWRRTSGDAAHPSGMGLKFVKLEDGTKELILKLVDEAVQRGSTAPAQPLATAVRQTDSYRPSAAPAPDTSEPPKQEAAAAVPVTATNAEAAAATAPAAKTPSVAPPAASATAPAKAPAAEPERQSVRPQPTAASSTHADEAPKASDSSNNLPLIIALAVGGGLVMWFLLH